MTKKIKANILLRNKGVKTLTANPDKPNLEYMGGIYVLSSDLIELNDKETAEVFFYEGNPTPINFKNEDKSKGYLNELLRINFIEQVDGNAPFSPGLLDGIKDLFKNPAVFIILVLGGAFLYSLWSSGFKL